MDALVLVTAAVMLTKEAAVSVNVLAALQLTALETVIAPVPPPPDPTVEIVTLQGSVQKTHKSRCVDRIGGGAIWSEGICSTHTAAKRAAHIRSRNRNICWVEKERACLPAGAPLWRPFPRTSAACPTPR